MKILQLSTYPCDVPRGGGEIRVAQIGQYLRNLGHEVACAGVLGSPSYPKTPHFVPYPKDAMDRLCNSNWYSIDYYLGKYVTEDEGIFREVLRQIPFIPNLILAEGPFFYPLAEKLAGHWGKNIKTIYSSHNIEYNLRDQLLQKLGISDPDFIQGIKSLEEYVCSRADSVWAVSEGDAQWQRAAGAKRVYVCPNGVENRKITEIGEQQFLEAELPEKYVLFCASGHLPNQTGFCRVFKEGIGCIPPDCKLVVVGSVCDPFSRDGRITGITKFSDRVKLLGVVDAELLASLLKHAHVIILPIFEGGGTNLKTAEAIWTGCHIVSTSVAMRGFDQFRGLCNLHIEDESSRFQQVIRHCLESEKFDSSNKNDGRELVLWEHCLSGIKDSLLNLEFVK